MLKRKKFWKRVGYVLGCILLLLLIGAIYVVQVSKVKPPVIKDMSSLQLQRTDHGNGFYTIKDSWFRHSKSGLFEMYVDGPPFEMGVINGKLSKELVVRQEDHFAEQISKLVPSNFQRHYLKYLIGFFNRNLDKNVKEEYLDEIYGVSESASPKYQYLGSNYQRILNYHAAHDIGHAVQNLALVGCTSFGTWGAMSQDSTMIIGRNFDFYVGDKFAQDKIVAFFNPQQGHKFMTVTWGGFIGAVSGMNDQGLSVTINAAKTALPTSSATPVSLVTREILQYAKNINEAIAIAKSRKMFVSESFLVASANDNKAVIIEKTPNALDVYDPHKDYIICANHFQSPSLSKTKMNIQQEKESASMYRYKRLAQLLDENGKNSVQKTINILRDQKGLNGANIGMGNEKAINQLIAHHSVVFEPKKLIVWVSTSPWQLGQYVAYDLKKIFALHGLKDNHEIIDSSLTIAPDSFLLTAAYKNFIVFRTLKQRILDGGNVDVDSLIASNPEFYNSYVLAGDYLYKQKKYAAALHNYQVALTKVIATKQEEEHIRKQIRKINEK
ncbi:MAG: C45 family peptidase [Ferruginibacter sp.]|nr:peptidase C45 [Bacteroidota bacterium]MBX2918252.1 peptidase C45 [Ferruginibacter sp.]MCB0708125.1 peptidase C45 [Chitinophagaceae bacterium]MCC7378088.1 peptidase C45 [Chitinophagaceae bacterium]